MDEMEFPAEAQAILAEIVAEMWRTVENGDRHTAGDYAADVAERLSYVYGVRGTAEPL